MITSGGKRNPAKAELGTDVRTGRRCIRPPCPTCDPLTQQCRSVSPTIYTKINCYAWLGSSDRNPEVQDHHLRSIRRVAVVEDFEQVVLSSAFNSDNVIGNVWDTIDHGEFGDRVDEGPTASFCPRVVLHADEGA